MDDLSALVKELEAIDARGQLLTTHQWMALASAGMRDSAAAEAHFAASRAYNPTAGSLADNGILVNALIGNATAARVHLNEYVRLGNQLQNLTAEGMRTRDENVHRMTGAVLYAERKYAEALAELKQGGLNPYVSLFIIECHKAMKNNKEADAARAALFTRREFTGNSTAAAIIRYRARK